MASTRDSRAFLALAAAAVAVCLPACASDEAYRKDENREGLTTAHDLNFKDYQLAAENLIQSLLASGALDRSDGLTPILVVSDIRNETLQHLDMQLLTQKVRIALNKSGKAQTTTAVGLDGPEDRATGAIQDLAGDPNIDPDTLPEARKVVAPNFSLGGTITQKKTKVGSRSESYFSIFMTLSDLRTGLAVWEDEKEIVKEEDKGWFGF